MRNFLMAAIVAIGAAASAPAMAAPSLAGLDAMTTSATESSGIEQAQYRGRRDDDRRRFGRSYRSRGYGYGRRFGGPPPHARAYGRRGHDRRW